MHLLLTLLFGYTVSAAAPILTSPYVQPDAWVPKAKDRLIVDIRNNRGYLIGLDGFYTSFPVGTGQRRTVRYIGKVYNAATPRARWTIQSLEYKQGDRATYGNTGRFFRLNHEQWGRTQYGIHATSNIEEILAKDNRYASMGCILVSDDILTILEQSLALHDSGMQVITVDDVDIDAISMGILEL